MSLLTAESKDVQWPAGATEKVRLQPTLAMILDAARPASQTKSDQLTLGALKVACITGILAEDFRRVYGWLGMLVGCPTPDGKGSTNGAAGGPGGKALLSREVGCPACGTHFLVVR